MAYEKYKTSGYLVINLFKTYYQTNLTADEIAKKISSSPFIIGMLGNYYELSLDGNSELLEKAMKDLAFRASDIPKADSFYDAMKSQMDSDFVYVVKFASSEAAKDLSTAVVNVVSPLAFLFGNFWLVAIIGGVTYVYYKNRK